MTSAQITFLGDVKITVAGRELRLARRQPLILLAYLALAPGAIARDTLAFLFWPDVAHEKSRQRLRRILGQLRAPFQALGVADPIQVRGEQIGFRHDCWQIDTREFERLAASGTAKGHEAATALYTGPFLAGLVLDDHPELDQWHRIEGERLARLHRQTLAALREAYAAEGALHQAIAVAEQLLALDPLHEETHRALMILFANTGRREEALRQYERCAAALDAELGVEPLPETRELRDKLLRGGAIGVSNAGVRPRWPIRRSLAVSRVGRAGELGALHAAINEGLAGRPTIACISGPVGIGKTRLLQEAAREVKKPIWLGMGQPTGQGIAYGTVLPALRAALASHPDLPSLPDLWLAETSRLLPEIRLARPDLRPHPSPSVDHAQVRLFEGLTRLLQALARREGGAVLILDNLEEADSTSLNWLASLADRGEPVPLGIVVAYRTTTETGALRSWLEHLARQDIRRDIHLSAFSPAETEELLGKLGFPIDPLARRLWDETGGNPFFLLETARLLQERAADASAPHDRLPLPVSVQEVIHSRAQRLDQATRQILDAAAILGLSFAEEVAREIGGRDEAETASSLDLLVAGQFLSEDQGGYSFSHGQVAEAIYAHIGGARRRLLHRRAANALRLHRVTDATQIARHWEQAGEWAEAAAAWLSAAEQASRLFATEQTLAMVAQGLALPGEQESRFALLLLREDLLDRLGRRLEQANDLDALAQIAAHLDPARQATVFHRRGRFLLALSKWAEAEEALRRSLVLAPHTGADARLALIRALGEQRRWDEATALGELALSEAGNDPRRGSRALHALAQLARLREDRPTLERHLRAALTLMPPDDPSRPRLILDLAEVLFRQEQHEAALVMANEALQLACQQADRTTEALAQNQVGNCLTRLHRGPEALEAFRRAGDAHRAIENHAGQAAATGNMGVLAMRLGLLEESLTYTQETLALFATVGNITGQCLAENNLGTALIWLDRSAEAVPYLRRALERAVANKLPLREAATCCNLGAALLDIGLLVEGESLMQRGVALRREHQYGDLAIDLACLAIAQIRSGDLEGADRSSLEALAELDAAERGVAHPQRVMFARAQVVQALGRDHEARAMIEQALRMLDDAAARLTSAAEQTRYRNAFSFNRALLAAQAGAWPDPPRLV